MATAAAPARSSLRGVLVPTGLDRSLAAASLAMLLVVLAALLRGYPHWMEAKATVWVHLLTIIVALATTPFLLLQRRGTALHRRLGYVWAAAMFGTAAVSLFIHESGPGWFSPIHVLSVLTLIGVPGVIVTARAHQHARHRFIVRSIVIGALLIAGFFTFPFRRMLGRWLLA